MSASINRLSTSEVSLEQTLAWLTKKAEAEDFSLTHVWGALTSAGIMKQVQTQTNGFSVTNGTFSHNLLCLLASWTSAISRAKGTGMPPTPTLSTVPLRSNALTVDPLRVFVFLCTR